MGNSGIDSPISSGENSLFLIVEVVEAVKIVKPLKSSESLNDLNDLNGLNDLNDLVDLPQSLPERGHQSAVIKRLIEVGIEPKLKSPFLKFI